LGGSSYVSSLNWWHAKLQITSTCMCVGFVC